MDDLTADERADHLASIAIELVTRVRDQDPASVHRWLTSVVDDADWMALCVVLACAVPDDQPWSKLTNWTWIRTFGLGGEDTPEAIARRRRDLAEALAGAD